MSDSLLRLVTETPVANVRNFSILAHVDHGKTTISDHLLTTNGLLSNALAGQVRYLDSRPDEQERLITMKASSVALMHKLGAERVEAFDGLMDASAKKFEVDFRREQEEKKEQQDEDEEVEEEEFVPLPSSTGVTAGNFVCNLLDCPGHVDFSSEVAAAVRLCDGAVIVVDLVDGVTMVTRAMLRQCYLEGLPMVLLLNKLDAIILRMQLTAEEGFARMTAAVSECNAFLASCVASEDIAAAGLSVNAAAGGGAGGADQEDEEAAAAAAAVAATDAETLMINDEHDEYDENTAYDHAAEEDDDDDDEEQAKRKKKTILNKKTSVVTRRALNVPADEVWFCPSKGNVLFGSGLHGFGFQLADFAALYKSKVPFLTTTQLTGGMWGQHFVDPRTKSIVDQPRKEGTPPLGVQLFCEPLWQLHLAFHDVGSDDLDKEKITEMLSKIGVTPRANFFNTSQQARQAAVNRFGLEGVHLPKLFSLLGEWKPLSRVLLDTICYHLPSPPESQSRRAPLLLPPIPAAVTAAAASGGEAAVAAAEQLKALNAKAEAVLAACDRSEDAPLYAYVAKLFDVQYLAGVLPPLREDENENEGGGKKKKKEGGGGDDQQPQFDLDTHFVALTRVMSGRLRRGAVVCVESGGRGPTRCTVSEVFILRGQGLEAVPYVAAGNVCAIRGCSNNVVKCATICDFVPDAGDADDSAAAAASTTEVEFDRIQRQQNNNNNNNALPFLAPIRLLSSSVVQLALTPEHPEDLSTLMRGLRLLYQTDPQVEVAVLPSGDHVIRCAGEVHAERCIEDLRTTFARVNLKVSDPIVGLRETVAGVYRLQCLTPEAGGNATGASVVGMPTVPNNNNASAAADPSVVTVALSQTISLQLAVISLPPDVLEQLLLNAAEDSGSAPQTARRVVAMLRTPSLVERRHGLWKRLFRVMTDEQKAGIAAKGKNHLLQHANVVAWGPSKMNFCGNVLLDVTGLFPALDSGVVPTVIQEAVISGFELGVSRGPMADEPMFGLAVCIVGVQVANVVEAVNAHLQQQNVQLDAAQFAEYVRQVAQQEGAHFLQTGHQQQQVDPSEAAASASAAVNFGGGVLTGHIVSSVATACRQAFSAVAGKQRVVEPFYECIVSSQGQTRGKIYTILHRRRAQIVEESLQEGSDLFSIRSRIPATESFGLQDELRTATSGAATAQLRVERWDVLDEDPFFKPRTREEIEELGETVDKPNMALTIIEQVRKRKGLFRQQVVKHAEKQKFSIRGG